jgi:hypothetical protein
MMLDQTLIELLITMLVVALFIVIMYAVSSHSHLCSVLKLLWLEMHKISGIFVCIGRSRRGNQCNQGSTHWGYADS